MHSSMTPTDNRLQSIEPARAKNQLSEQDAKILAHAKGEAKLYSHQFKDFLQDTPSAQVLQDAQDTFDQHTTTTTNATPEQLKALRKKAMKNYSVLNDISRRDACLKVKNSLQNRKMHLENKLSNVDPATLTTDKALIQHTKDSMELEALQHIDWQCDNLIKSSESAIASHYDAMHTISGGKKPEEESLDLMAEVLKRKLEKTE